jgi:hypothetical protein
MPDFRCMQYNGRCGYHFMKPMNTLIDTTPESTVKLGPDVADLPAAGKVTFYVSKNMRGLKKDFDYDGTPVIFNNQYRQTLDESGKPLLKSIFSGAFQSTDKPNFPTDETNFDIIRERKQGKRTNIPKPNNLDTTKNCPLIQSTLNGAYYGELRDERNTYIQKPNLIDKYRRSIAVYSSVVKTIKPVKSHHAGYCRCQCQMSIKDPKPAIPRVVADKEINAFYEGQRTTRTAAVIAQYLANCGMKEKRRFARSLGTSSLEAFRTRPELAPVRCSSQNNAPMDAYPIPETGGPASQGEDVSAAAATLRLIHRQAIQQAKRLAQSRARQGPIVAALPQASSPTQRADILHKDLQVSAFGATFASSGLSSLPVERILKR